MQKSVLMVSAAQDAERCATVLAEQLGLTVEIATHRRAALAAVRRREYGLVLLEESIAESDPAWTDLLVQNAGFAVPLQVRIAASGCARLVREVRAALERCGREQALARRRAAAVFESELKGSLTGLLLQSELALREPSIPAELAPKLRRLVELAGVIRQQLQPAPVL